MGPCGLRNPWLSLLPGPPSSFSGEEARALCHSRLLGPMQHDLPMDGFANFATALRDDVPGPYDQRRRGSQWMGTGGDEQASGGDSEEEELGVWGVASGKGAGGRKNGKKRKEAGGNGNTGGCFLQFGGGGAMAGRNRAVGGKEEEEDGRMRGRGRCKVCWVKVKKERCSEREWQCGGVKLAMPTLFYRGALASDVVGRVRAMPSSWRNLGKLRCCRWMSGMRWKEGNKEGKGFVEGARWEEERQDSVDWEVGRTVRGARGTRPCGGKGTKLQLRRKGWQEKGKERNTRDLLEELPLDAWETTWAVKEKGGGGRWELRKYQGQKVLQQLAAVLRRWKSMSSEGRRRIMGLGRKRKPGLNCLVSERKVSKPRTLEARWWVRRAWRAGGRRNRSRTSNPSEARIVLGGRMEALQKRMDELRQKTQGSDDVLVQRAKKKLEETEKMVKAAGGKTQSKLVFSVMDARKDVGEAEKALGKAEEELAAASEQVAKWLQAQDWAETLVRARATELANCKSRVAHLGFQFAAEAACDVSGYSELSSAMHLVWAGVEGAGMQGVLPALQQMVTFIEKFRPVEYAAEDDSELRELASGQADSSSATSVATLVVGEAREHGAEGMQGPLQEVDAAAGAVPVQTMPPAAFRSAEQARTAVQLALADGAKPPVATAWQAGRGRELPREKDSDLRGGGSGARKQRSASRSRGRTEAEAGEEGKQEPMEKVARKTEATQLDAFMGTGVLGDEAARENCLACNAIVRPQELWAM